VTVSDNEPTQSRGSGFPGALNGVLALVVLILVVGVVLILAKGAAVVPGKSSAEKLTDQYAAVTAAGRAETLAFLDVDYKNMDPQIAKVLKGATGSFKQQYNKSKVEMKAAAQQATSVSTGKVLQVSIGDISATKATLFVAADSQVKNKATKGVLQPRYWRIQLSMVRTGGAWLLSDLQFVG
jgi:Mce-associated membrane protein